MEFSAQRFAKAKSKSLVFKTPRIWRKKFLGALENLKKNKEILDDPRHAPEFIPRVLDSF